MDLSVRHRQVLEHIRARSPYDSQETERVLAKFFAHPQRLVSLLYGQHGFGEKRVLDIGSSYGQTLLYWGDTSEGFDISDRFIQFLESLGRTVHRGNVEEGLPTVPKESFDAVYTNNLFEHLVSPHLFLARLFAVLKPGGTLAIGHPVIPPQPFRAAWSMLGFKGWLAAEHINFFTPMTARWFLERSGFRVERQYFSGAARVPLLARLTVPFGVHCMSVCTKKPGYTYEPKRYPEFDPSWAADIKVLR